MCAASQRDIRAAGRRRTRVLPNKNRRATIYFCRGVQSVETNQLTAVNSASELELENFGIVRATHPRAIIITIISRSIATNRLFCCEKWKKKKEGRSQHRLEWGNSNTLRALGSPRASCYKIRSHCNNSTADEGWTARRTMCVTRSPAGPCDDASQDNDQFQHRWRRSNNQRTFFQELRMRAEELKVQKVAQGKTKNKKRVKTLYISLYIIIIRRKKEKKGKTEETGKASGGFRDAPAVTHPPFFWQLKMVFCFLHDGWRKTNAQIKIENFE